MAEPVARISLWDLILAARELVSEDGENPEYDRALVELACEAFKIPMDESWEIERLVLRGDK